MILIIDKKQYQYDLESLVRVFFPMEKLKTVLEPAEAGEEAWIRAGIEDGLARAEVCIEGKSQKETRPVPEGLEEEKDACTLALATALYEALGTLTGYRPQWGILTGVRPAKLMHRLTAVEGEREKAAVIFEKRLLVTPKKVRLTMEVADCEDRIISLSRPRSFSLYVSIPFCPTRCSYCSFVSHSMGSAKKLMAPYVELLVKELAMIGKIARELDLRLETVYFGGGTPTTLSAEQLSLLFTTMEGQFDLSFVREYTVEAGRPDTITREKLEAIRAHGVTRISINPQTFNDGVLETIGRKHTAQETVEAFRLAKKLGFDNINMDFIAGLPGETLESFENSLKTAVELGAESVTVHTLALKRSSYLVTKSLLEEGEDRTLTSQMVDYAGGLLPQNGYAPYYMYRQSKTVGNLENVGWSKPGKEGYYNVYMMDETHTILSAGAGAVTKLRVPGENYIERIYNFKYPYEYIGRFEEMTGRKKRINEFYREYL